MKAVLINPYVPFRVPWTTVAARSNPTVNPPSSVPSENEKRVSESRETEQTWLLPAYATRNHALLPLIASLYGKCCGYGSFDWWRAR